MVGSTRKVAQTLMPGAIDVVCADNGTLICRRCDKLLALSGVAFLSRTSPSDAFEAWCVECSLTLSRWALTGAVDHGWMDPSEAAGLF